VPENPPRARLTFRTRSEAFPGAIPVANNTPQKPAFGLRTERISGSSFTASRDHNLQTWIYRQTSSLDHDEFVPYNDSLTPKAPKHISPNSYMWTSLPTSPNADWLSQTLLAGNGDPATKTGLAVWTFSITKDMPANTAFSSLDGDCLIIPQAGALDIQTELGKLLVRQNEICVIPRGVRYRVTLPEGKPCRGFINEIFQSHFRLPELGIVGSSGLAQVRDFQIPTAFFDGTLNTSTNLVQANNTDWTIVSRQASRLWKCSQDHTPFDVAAWHGTFYPYKYDLARFCVLGNALFDEHDPCLYVVLTAPAYGEPGNALVDFAIIPPRWQVSEDTFWLPYYHRNTMVEFYAPIVNAQSPQHPFNGGQEFKPFAAGMNGPMTTHGAAEEEFVKTREMELKPTKLMTDGVTIFLLETEKPLFLADWAAEGAQKNFKVKKEAKM
jgi:homogentisate 1,2-dioxygenase